MKSAATITLIIAGAILAAWGARDLLTNVYTSGVSQFAGATAMFCASLAVRFAWPD